MESLMPLGVFASERDPPDLNDPHRWRTFRDDRRSVRRLVRIAIGVAAFTLLPGAAAAQAVEISGKVVTTQNAPLPGATVTLERTDGMGGWIKPPVITSSTNGVTTGASDQIVTVDVPPNARAIFKWDIPAGVYRLRVSKPGCFDPANRDKPYVETSGIVLEQSVRDRTLMLACEEINLPPAECASEVAPPTSGGVGSGGIGGSV